MKKALRNLLFIVALIIKAIDGFLEAVGGILLLLVKPKAINVIVVLLTQHELSEDPSDFIATNLVKLASNFSINPSHFASFYLLSHGFLKIFLVIFLLLGRRWAYPAFLTFISIFIVYQTYRISHTHSVLLTIFTLFDIFVAWLVWRKYRELNRSSS